MTNDLFEQEHPAVRRFERVTRKRPGDLVALVALSLFICGLAVTTAWMWREVGRGVAIAAACDGQCTGPAADERVAPDERVAVGRGAERGRAPPPGGAAGPSRSVAFR